MFFCHAFLTVAAVGFFAGFKYRRLLGGYRFPRRFRRSVVGLLGSVPDRSERPRTCPAARTLELNWYHTIEK